MPSHAVLRLLESFFRHPVLHLLPLVAFAALGSWYVSSQEDVYQSAGVVLVDDQTLLASLTGLRGGEAGLEGPAQFTSGQINTLLQTDTFVLGIAERAGLGDVTTLTGDDTQRLRESIGAWGTGRDLVYVWAQDGDPQVARDLADATIQSLVDWKVENEVSDSVAAEGFLSPITQRYREEVAIAREALAAYVEENPAPLEGGRPAPEQVALTNLTMSVTDAEIRYSEALANEETARLAASQAESDIRNSLEVLDAPTVPTSPETSLRNLAVALLAFLVVGVLLSVASVVAFTVADRSVRFSADLDDMGVEVLALLPGPGRAGRRAVGARP